MATHYEYVMAVWLRLIPEMSTDEVWLKALEEHIAKDFQIHKIEEVENEDSDSEEDVGERTVSLQVQLIFDPSEMEDDEPTEDAISRFDEELRTHLTSRYQVTHLDVLDDGLTSYLLAELDESDETQTKCTNGL